MIDFHSHILPGIDDGSKDTDESLAMLKMLWEQGIDTVIATAHFHPEEESVKEFIDRRQDSYNKLSPLLEPDLPVILLGAEVMYYDGISSLSDLELLCIGNTGLLLLEMPMCKWSEYAMKELNALSSAKGYTVILAHIERYLKFQPSSVWQKLSQLGLLMQVNASFFNSAITKRKALSMLIKGNINVLGSDSHNITTRPPNLGSAFDVIRKKLGDEFLKDLTDYHRNLILEDGGLS